MGDLVSGHTFTDGELVPAATLNNMQDGLTIAANAVTTAKILNGAVTAAKLDPTLNLSAGQIGLTSGKFLLGNGSNVGTAGTFGTTLAVTGSTLDIAAGGVGPTQLAANAVTTVKIADANVTLAKIANVTDARLLGRSAGSAGAPMELTVGAGLALAAGVLSAAGGGNIRFAGWFQLTSPVTIVGTTYQDSGLTLTVTPASSGSKFIVMAFLNGSTSGLQEVACWKLQRNGTDIDVPASPSTRTACGASFGLSASGNEIIHSATLMEYDQPATASPVTYKVQGRTLGVGAGLSAYLNRAYDDTDATSRCRAVSSLLVIEITS